MLSSQKKPQGNREGHFFNKHEQLVSQVRQRVIENTEQMIKDAINHAMGTDTWSLAEAIHRGGIVHEENAILFKFDGAYMFKLYSPEFVTPDSDKPTEIEIRQNYVLFYEEKKQLEPI